MAHVAIMIRIIPSENRNMYFRMIQDSNTTFKETVYKSPYHVYTWTSGMKSLTKSRISPHDAVFAHAGTSLRNDEVVIFDDAQVTLQYIIELKQQ